MDPMDEYLYRAQKRRERREHFFGINTAEINACRVCGGAVFLSTELRHMDWHDKLTEATQTH